MKARFKYRIYPTLGQKHRLSRLVGSLRVVWNDSLACSGGKVQTLKEKNQLILNYKNSLLLWLKRLRIEFGNQLFLHLPLQQSLNDVSPGLSKLF